MDEWDVLLEGLTLGRMLTQRAEKCGDKIALHYLPDDRKLTYRQLEDDANRVANGLKRHGIGRGSHVGVMTENRLEQIITYFALGKLGAASVPINVNAKGYFLERFAGQSDCTAIIMEPDYLANLAAAGELPAIETIFLFDSFDGAAFETPAALANRRFVAFNTLFDSPADLVDEGEPGDLLHILYTSGTTGPSKGNMFTHTAVLNWASQMSARQELQGDDVYLTMFPIYHGGAWLNATLSTLWVTGAVAVGRKFSASQFLNHARQSGATKGIMISVASFLTARPPSPADRDHKLKCLFGSPPPPDLEGFEKRFGLLLVNGYGLTDYGTSHFGRPSDPRGMRRSVGQPYPGWEVKIADEQGRRLPPGTAGEILLRCDVPGGTAHGYYKLPEASLEARRDLWFHTGDLGYVDEDNYLYFVDRKKDAIRRYGENISSVELEMVMRRHPAVADAAFFPVNPDSGDGQVGVAVIANQGHTITEIEIVRHCQQHMPKFAIPRFVRVVSAFPMTGSGKVQKAVIRAETEKMIADVWDREKQKQ